MAEAEIITRIARLVVGCHRHVVVWTREFVCRNGCHVFLFFSIGAHERSHQVHDGIFYFLGHFWTVLVTSVCFFVRVLLFWHLSIENVLSDCRYLSSEFRETLRLVVASFRKSMMTGLSLSSLLVIDPRHSNCHIDHYFESLNRRMHCPFRWAFQLDLPIALLVKQNAYDSPLPCIP